MIDNSYFITAVSTILDCVIEDSSVKPCAIVKNDLFGSFVVIIDLIGEEISLVEFGFIDGDFLRIVSNFNLRMSQVEVSVFLVIGVSDIELEIIPIILEN